MLRSSDHTWNRLQYSVWESTGKGTRQGVLTAISSSPLFTCSPVFKTSFYSLPSVLKALGEQGLSFVDLFT